MIGRTLPRLLLSLVVVALFPGCGGGGGGNPPPAMKQPMIVFSAGGTPVAKSVFLSRGPGSTGTTLVLRVEVMEVNDLYGVAFDLSYPSNLLRYDAVSEGAFLSGGGAFGTSLQVVETAPGQLVVGLSRLGAVAGASGSGALLDLQLASVAAGSGGFGFARQSLFSSGGLPQVGVTWIGGSVTVTR